MSEAEYASITEMSLEAGMSLSDFCRQRLLQEGRVNEQKAAAPGGDADSREVDDGLAATSDQAAVQEKDDEIGASVAVSQQAQEGASVLLARPISDSGRQGPVASVCEPGVSRLCPRCTRIGRPTCSECLSKRANE